MGKLIWYWVIGCILVGLITGAERRNCPTSQWLRMSSAQYITAVAVWPVFVASAITSGSGSTCEKRSK